MPVHMHIYTDLWRTFCICTPFVKPQRTVTKPADATSQQPTKPKAPFGVLETRGIGAHTGDGTSKSKTVEDVGGGDVTITVSDGVTNGRKAATDGVGGSDGMAATVDTVRLGAVGWKARYYKSKFGVDVNVDEGFIQRLVANYIEGICWTMLYYYQGCASWQWYYGYHYTPMASDMHGLSQLCIGFCLGVPFSPLEQLMAVLPPKSAHCIPAPCRELMIAQSSPIKDFYPLDFKVHII